MIKHAMIIVPTLIMLALANPSLALPGMQMSPSTHFKSHPFFPESEGYGGEASFGSAKILTGDRLLIWNISLSDLRYDMSDMEEFYVVPKNCIYRTGFVFFDSNQNDCPYSLEFEPAQPENPRILEIISKAYPQYAQTIIPDLKQSKKFKTMHRYFWMDYPERRLLKGSGVIFNFYRGVKFDYILTPVGFAISRINGDGEQYLFKSLEEDNKLIQKLKNQQNQHQFEQQKRQPYEL